MPVLTSINHEKFAQHYAVYGNLRKAVADLELYNSRAARALLHHPKIAARIEELIGESFREARVSATRTLTELGRIAYFDMRELYDADGHMRAVHELDDDTAACITRIDVEVEGKGRGEERELVITKKIRAADKMAALGLLARHFKIVGEEDDGVNALANALADRLKQARKRTSLDNVSDAVIHEAEGKIPEPGTRLEYGYDGDPSNANDVTAPRLIMPAHDAEALHSLHPVPEREAFKPAPRAAPQPIPRSAPPAPPIPPAPPAQGDDDETLW